LRSLFQHILVDEFQDTNAVQADIVAGMAGDNVCVAAVGDDAQAIYGFRSGSARHMIEFPQRFPNARVVTLDRNYRSTPQVLAVSEGQALKRLLGEDCPKFPSSALPELEGLQAAFDDCLDADIPPADQVERFTKACTPIFERRYPGTSSVRLADLELLRLVAT